MEEREKFKKEVAQKFEEKRNRERVAANERDRKLDERASKRRSEDVQRIERIERAMNYDPELYADKLEKAMERFDFAVSINPYSVLKMKKEWWDNNPYIQAFADELYEPQRLERQATSRQLLNQKINAYHDAKNLFLYAMENVDKDSEEQLFLLDKIEDCNVSLDINDVSATYGDQFEKERIQAREDARILEQTNRFIDHRDRARAAYLVLERDPNEPAKYLVATYELAQRMDEAQKSYEENLMVVGASQSIVTSVIQDSSKNSILNSVSYLFNLYASAGIVELPIILNVTGDNIDSQSLVSETSFITANVGKDFWWFKSKFFDIGTAAYFGYGSNFPKKGVESYFLHYSGRVNMNFGYKKLKLATVTEFVGRSGKLEEDFDVINADQLGLGATNRFDKSSFNYTVLRFGAGLRYEMSNAVGDEYNFLQLTAYAEKPSFYPFAITEKPVITYELELLLFGGLKFEFAYSNYYVVAGTADYSIAKIEDKNFFRASIGKVWNIL